MPTITQLSFLTKALRNYVQEDGIDIKLRDGYVCIWMADWLIRYGIELTDVFPKEGSAQNELYEYQLV